MKYLFLSVSFFLISILSSQDFGYKIPKEADAVVLVKGNKFQEFMTLEEFNSSKIGEKIIGELFEDQKKDKDIRSLGINLSSNLYYYKQDTDSISYNCYWFPLSDMNKFENQINKKHASEIRYNGSIRKLRRDNSLLLWDNEKLFIVTGELKEDYFTITDHYGVKEISRYDYPIDSIEIEKVEENFPIPKTDIISDSIDSYTERASSYYDVNDHYDIQAYEKAYDEQQKIKDELLRKWEERYADEVFNRTENSPSILEDPDYKKSMDKNAVMTFFLKDRFLSLLPYGYNFLGYRGECINGKIFINKNNIRLVSEMKIEEKNLASYKGIYNHKLNKKLLNYVDEDKVIGFSSVSFNTEEYLKSLPSPNLLLDLCEVTRIDSDEMKLYFELFSLLLDEKAVAKVVKGDGLFLFNGISNKEYTYTDYDYDENYNKIEIKKEKKEKFPEFLFMFSSEDPHIIESFLKFGIKEEKVKFQNDIYSIYNSDMKPFSVHVLIKDGIVFLSNSYEDLYKIKTNTYSAKIDKKLKQFLLKNNTTVFLNPKKLENKILKEEFRGIDDVYRKIFGAMGNVYTKTTGIKGGYQTGEAIIEVQKEDQNGLKYFLRITEMLLDL